jgi:hypothetical protein
MTKGVATNAMAELTVSTPTVSGWLKICCHLRLRMRKLRLHVGHMAGLKAD